MVDSLVKVHVSFSLNELSQIEKYWDLIPPIPLLSLKNSNLLPNPIVSSSTTYI